MRDLIYYSREPSHGAKIRRTERQTVLVCAAGLRRAGARWIGLSLCWLLASAPLLSARADVDWPTLGEVKKIGGGEHDAALIAAVEHYTYVAPVPGARENAEAWHRYLTEARNVPVDKVTLLLDQKVTVEKLERFASEAATRVEKGGTLWFIFVGHGAPSRDGKDGLLVGVDAQQDADSLFARSVGQGSILARLSKGPAKQIVAIVDACFSGRLPSGKPIVAGLQPLLLSSQEPLPASNAVVLTAARSDEFAGPLPGTGRPAFSYLVLGGLRGWADADADGLVSAQELTEYSSKVLRAMVRDRTQTPSLAGDRTVTLGKAWEPGPELAPLVRRYSDGQADKAKTAAAGSNEAPGSVYVTSNVQGAQVLLDGQPVGVTPLRVERVAAGQHVVELRQGGVTAEPRVVTVAPGALVAVSLALAAESRRAPGEAGERPSARPAAEEAGGRRTSDAGLDVNGAWNFNFMNNGSWANTVLHLEQRGDFVTGTFGSGATCDGRFTGRTLTGTWSNGGHGRWRVTFSEDGNSFSGFWGGATGPLSLPENGTRRLAPAR